MDLFFWKMLFSTFLVLLGFLLLHLYDSLVAKPTKIRRILQRQGIDGPPPKLLLGNILEIKRPRDSMDQAAITHRHPPVIHNTASVFSFLEQWRKQYGLLYTFSLGKMQILYVSKPDIVKEITTCTSHDLGRPSHQQQEFGPLLGQGILTSNGLTWARHRKIIAPELFMDKVKGMMDIITESVLTLVTSWEHEIDNGVLEFTVDDYMKRFSGDIISRACFGSSHAQGQEIFTKFGILQELISSRITSLGIPGLRYIPTRMNRRIWALDREIQGLILKVVKERQLAGSEKDLLQILLESAQSSHSSSDLSIHQFIVDNCRNIYLAGFETSAVAASWCVMLLASNPDWQTRIRNEVKEVCNGRIPDMDMLRQMKQLNMVIQETIRLYPPTPTISREALEEMTLGNILVPKGVHIWTMVAALHTDTTIWGADALEFRPERFQNGITGACKCPRAYMPFGFGRRVCVGQHLAMVELKLLMASIVSNFSFAMSPNYVHSPIMRMIVEPKYGVKILVQKLL